MLEVDAEQQIVWSYPGSDQAPLMQTEIVEATPVREQVWHVKLQEVLVAS